MSYDKRAKALIKRLRFIAGQVSAIEQMIVEGRSPSDVYAQLRSVSSAFDKSVLATFEDTHRKRLAELVVGEREGCPGSCDHCDFIETVQRDFPKLTTTEVLKLLHQIQMKEDTDDA